MSSAIYEPRGLMTHQVDESGDLILHDPTTGELVVLNAVGAAAYELVDGKRSADDIAQELAGVFVEVPATQVAGDVHTFLADLARRGLLKASSR